MGPELQIPFLCSPPVASLWGVWKNMLLLLDPALGPSHHWGTDLQEAVGYREHSSWPRPGEAGSASSRWSWWSPGE